MISGRAITLNIRSRSSPKICIQAVTSSDVRRLRSVRPTTAPMTTASSICVSVESKRNFLTHPMQRFSAITIVSYNKTTHKTQLYENLKVFTCSYFLNLIEQNYVLYNSNCTVFFNSIHDRRDCLFYGIRAHTALCTRQVKSLNFSTSTVVP